ncbi:MAG: SPOR domain-containing protein, partial [Cyclonatronaceae bacterium]
SGAEITEQPEQEPEVSEERPMSSMLSSGDYNELRISPGARNMDGEAEIPAVFVEDEEDESGRESDSGFRIQLMSTTDIAVADSMSLEYYDWIETLDAESISFSPVPDAYITFRQPYYRVRIGDFRQRSQANTYLRLLRERFQGAWVVLDTIDPEMVPEP